MSVMSWLHEKFGLPHDRPEDTAFRRAMHAANELTTMTRSLREQLKPYCSEDDPFTSIMKKHEMAQEYDEGQIRDIHHGPPK